MECEDGVVAGRGKGPKSTGIEFREINFGTVPFLAYMSTSVTSYQSLAIFLK